MRQRRFPTACLAILAVLALGAGIASAPSVALAQATSAPDAGTITTELQPGWNMIGWVGPETLSGQLFEELPALRQISAWDAEEQRYRRARPNINRDSLRLMPGMGLLLFIDGDAPLQWTHPIGPDGALQRLRPGLNLVGWTGDDGTPVGEALDRLGDSVITAWDWDAGSGQYAIYDLSASGGASASLGRGDALWIRVSEPVNWWQPGPGEPPIFFLGEIATHIRMAIRAEYENVQTFFAERFGVVPEKTPLYVGADTEALHATLLAVFAREPGEEFCGRTELNQHIQVLAVGCAYPVRKLLLHETQVGALLGLRLTTAPDGGPLWIFSGPEWMVRGTESYARILYAEAARSRNYEVARRERVYAARLAGLPMDSVDMRGNEDGLRGWAIGGVGFLAVEWLASRAGDPAIFEYHRLRESSETWEEAFATAFGITVEDFYAEFEVYRKEVAPPFPHVVGDQRGIAVAFVGDVPEDTQVAILADLAVVQAYMTERFGAEPAEFTLYVGPDTASILAEVPQFNRSAICQQPGLSLGAMALDLCGTYPRHDIWYIQALIPNWDIPPRWLAHGAEEYLRTAYGREIKGENLDSHVAWLRGIAGRTSRSLESLETDQGIVDAGYSTTRALGLLAAELLVTRAGPSALLDFYEKMPTHENWERLFRTTFHVTLTAFYEAFEGYRTRIRP